MPELLGFLTSWTSSLNSTDLVLFFIAEGGACDGFSSWSASTTITSWVLGDGCVWGCGGGLWPVAADDDGFVDGFGLVLASSSPILFNQSCSPVGCPCSALSLPVRDSLKTSAQESVRRRSRLGFSPVLR